MRAGLSIEGPNDQYTVQILVERVLAGLDLDWMYRPHRGYASLERELKDDLVEYEVGGVKLVVVVADNDRSSRNHRKRQLNESMDLHPSLKEVTIIGIAVQALEAWLLADEKAMSTACGRDIRTQPNPETIDDPKNLLRSLVQIKTLSIPHPQLLSKIAHALRIDFVRTKSDSFNIFCDDLLKFKRITTTKS